MIKVLLIVILVSNIYAKFYDKVPDKITNQDIKIIKNYDNLEYKLNEANYKTINISKIYSIIKKYPALRAIHSKIKVYASGSVGYRKSARQQTILKSQGKFYEVSLNVEIPLIDEKTSIEMQNKKITYQLQAINKIKEYAELYAKLQDLKQKLIIARLNQIRLKAEVKTGMKYRDERIKQIELIQQIKSNIALTKAQLLSLKEYLLSLTTNKDLLRQYL